MKDCSQPLSRVVSARVPVSRYSQPSFVVPAAGFVPFVSILFEMKYILSSLWTADTYYHVYGFMLMVFVILVVTLVCTTIVAVYFVLNAEVRVLLLLVLSALVGAMMPGVSESSTVRVVGVDISVCRSLKRRQCFVVACRDTLNVLRARAIASSHASYATLV